MLRTLRGADVAAGIVVLALGAAFLAASFQIVGVESSQQGIHPRTVPVIISATLVLAGLGLAVGAARSPLADKRVSWPDRAGWRSLLVTMISLVAYMALLEPLGFPLATLVFMSLAVWYLGRYNLLAVLVLALLTAALILGIFIELLGLSFPVGPLPV